MCCRAICQCIIGFWAALVVSLVCSVWIIKCKFMSLDVEQMFGKYKENEKINVKGS